MTEQPKRKSSRLRKFNNVLSVVNIVLALYILIAPFWLMISFRIRDAANIRPALVKAETAQTSVAVPADNTLVIPALNMQETIHEGSDESVLSKGAWRRPASGNPKAGGNFVVVGHRFTYAGSAVFYHLDKLKQNDDIVVYWEGKKYVYKVTETKIVTPNQTEIEKNTDKNILTLYTCTPLWTAENRLVVIAELQEAR